MANVLAFGTENAPMDLFNARRSYSRQAEMIRATALRVQTRETARSWTGRSATSVATDSGVPHLVISGTFRTRVSEMRDFAPGARARTKERRSRVAEWATLSGKSAGG
jgi:hypothetical protein